VKYVVVALLLGACAAPAQSRAPNVAPALTAAPPLGGAAVAAPAPTSAGATPNPTAETAPSAPAPGPAPNAVAPVGPVGPAERHGPPLPELSVKSFGLHIGGSAQDAAARDEFLRALEAASWRYLDCYRLVEQPGSVGTFGADLTVGAAGGRATVKKPRTKLRGEAFQTCMLNAFEGVSFPRTPSGRAAVVSYSVKFNLK
jgi:hypothetical protein